MFSEADMTLTGLASLLVGCLDGARTRGDKLLCLTNSSQPKTVEIGKVVTGTAGTLALYDGVSPEVLKAATRRTQRLATTLITSPCVQEERVPRPQTPPARWACRDRVILAVKSYCGQNSLTHHTAADVGANLLAKEWHHGYGSGGGEPIRFVVATREVTGSFVAVGERHGGKNLEAGASLAQILSVRLLLSLQVDQTVAHPKLTAAFRTPWYLNCLAMDNQKEA